MKQESCRWKAWVCKAVLEQMSRAHASDLLGESYPLSDVFIRLDLRNPVPSAYGKLSGQLCAACKEELCNWSVVAARDIFAELSETFGLQSTKLVNSHLLARDSVTDFRLLAGRQRQRTRSLQKMEPDLSGQFYEVYLVKRSSRMNMLPPYGESSTVAAMVPLHVFSAICF
ncbi:hypothetical protein K466DRAFT_218869 [Polyporus arcularius HHB13444]|uniref:Uncharacterized protein n=1 Tax=Polyporus arcularius HHB13444 TaxID=1314778 RepID=A0A5C3P5Y0_9APHY|nr:hypothetical protein K466DRAFT_218869 [Polyporus arcularius HHB13444]